MNSKQDDAVISRMRGECSQEEFWTELNTEQLQALRQALEHKLARRDNLLLALMLASLLGFCIAAWLLRGAAPEVRKLVPAVGLLVAGIFTMLAALGPAGQLRHFERSLRPLKDSPQQCVDALELLQYPSAAAFRDKVLAQGRELTQADFGAMQFLAERDRAAGAPPPETACRLLHGMPT